jgi:hypothetical protein
MGLESFRVELSGGNRTFSEACKAICSLDHVAIDHEALTTPGSAFFLRSDGKHLIELELMDSPMKLSCRFTLCHPSSVDSAFLKFVRELMVVLGMEARVCDDVPPEQSHSFSIDEFEEFSAVALRAIALRRREWIETFGAEQVAVTSSEVFERIILPHCEQSAGTTKPA